MDEYYQVQTLDPKKLPMVRERIWELVLATNMDRDLGVDDRPDHDFDSFLLHIDGYLCELKDAQIRDGLHTLGLTPEGEQRLGLLLAMSRLDNAFVPGLRTAGDAIERLEAVARALLAPIALEGDGIDAAIARFPDLAGSPEVREVLRFLATVVLPRLDRTPDEIANVLRALNGRYVPAGP